MKWWIQVPMWTSVFAAACGYWSAAPRGDTAPETWGKCANASAPATVLPSAETRSLSVETRLRNLENLWKAGVITDAEYRDRRKQVLADAFD